MQSNPNDTASRPKIHRLPDYTTPINKNSFMRNGVLLILVCGIIAVGSQIISRAQLSAPRPTGESTQTLSAAAPSADGSRPVMIHIQDESGQIVGQLAKIPSDTQRGAEVSTQSNIDSTTGKELLSIIGKY